MTTIVCTTHGIIADRRHTHGGYPSVIKKLFTIAENNFVGMSGDPSNFILALEYFKNWFDACNDHDKIQALYDQKKITEDEAGYQASLIDWPDRPNITEDFEALMLTPTGIFLIGPQLAPYLIEEKHYAIGSGANFALSALKFGSNLGDALEFASMNDVYTSADYDIEYLKNE